jgi:hypothetical protein
LKNLFGILMTVFVGGLMAGCGPQLPEKPKPTGPMANPAMAERRIKDTLANPRFTQAQKDQIIATIKQKNHMQ